MARRKVFHFLIIALICWIYCILPSLLSGQQSQQTDPFYLRLLEKAQKSFLAKNYQDAARDFEIASFGLTANKTLRAKAYVYLGICHYHLKNMAKSEDFLRQAYELVGEEGFESIGIAEAARPDLDNLLIFFNIRPAEKPVAVEGSAQAVDKAETQEKTAAQKENPVLPQKSTATKAKKPASASTKELPETQPITLDLIKEGGLVPLEMVETKPVAVRRIQPKYPSEALRAGIEGTVIVNTLISETGAVIKTEVIRGIKGALELDAAAQRAVSQWRFEPATIKGIRVKVWMPIAIEFRKQE